MLQGGLALGSFVWGMIALHAGVKSTLTIAAAALVARHWPVKGSRHEASKALAGLLCRAGWDEPSAMAFIEAVAVAAQD